MDGLIIINLVTIYQLSFSLLAFSQRNTEYCVKGSTSGFSVDRFLNSAPVYPTTVALIQPQRLTGRKTRSYSRTQPLVQFD